MSLIKERNERRRNLKARQRPAHTTSRTKVFTSDGTLVCDMNGSTTNSAKAEDNAAFLTHAPNDDVEADVDRLVAEVEQLQKLLSMDRNEND